MWSLHFSYQLYILISGAICFGPASSSKILLVTGPFYSHCLEVSSVGHELVRRGHEVSILFDSNFKHKDCYQKDLNGTGRIRPIIFQADPKSFQEEHLPKSLLAVLDSGKQFSPIENTASQIALNKLIAANLFYDTLALSNLRKEHFDLAIVDGAFVQYPFFLIPYKLGIPYVAFGSIFDDFLTGRPFLASFVPSIVLHYSDDMTFWEKLHNGLGAIMFYWFSMYMLPMEEINKIDPTLSRRDVLTLVSKSELFLLNSDHVLGFPQPVMPNHIEVGGMTTMPANPLTGQISRLYENSDKGVVLVTFGSTFGVLPERVEKAFLGALQRLNMDVLWKYVKEDKVGNVVRVKWLNQNDALGHPKTNLFISHCGNNGVFEALYHGVPILCTALTGDQVLNAARVRRWEVGEAINILVQTEDEIFFQITSVLKNPKYKGNMKRASAIFHSRPFPPRERAAYWVEHVLKFGGKHLRSRGSDMSTFCYLGYDLVCFACLVMLGFVFLFYKATKAMFVVCFRIQRRQKLD